MPAAAALLASSAGGQFRGADISQSLLYIWFTVTPSGAYAALGDTLDLTALGDALKSSGPPVDVEIKSYNPAGDSGFIYKYRPGTTTANGKFQVMTSNGVAPNPLLDLGAVAYPAAVLADKIQGVATFLRV